MLIVQVLRILDLKLDLKLLSDKMYLRVSEIPYSDTGKLKMTKIKTFRFSHKIQSKPLGLDAKYTAWYGHFIYCSHWSEVNTKEF